MDLSRVRWLHSGTERVALELKDELDTDKLGTLAEALDLLRQTKGMLSDLERFVEGAVAAAMPSKTHSEGNYFLERRSGSRRKWDTDAVLGALATRLVVPDTGEAVDALDVKTVRAVAGIGYFRTGALTQHGLEPNDFCEWEEGRPTVQVSRHELAENPDEVAS